MIRQSFFVKFTTAFWAVLVFLLMASCTGEKEDSLDSKAEVENQKVKSELWVWSDHLPVNFPEPYVPSDNPMSEQKFQLGRHLFYDLRLSGNASQSCSSCHFQHLAFTDGRAKSIGSTGDQTARSAQSLVNVAYYASLTWANPAMSSLERQATVPLFIDDIGVEMGVNDSNKGEVLARLQNDPYYVKQFASEFSDYPEPINFDTITKALAAFQRGLISANSKFDKVERGEAVLSDQEARGKKLFEGKGQCSQCHTGFMFSNHSFNAQSRRVKRTYHNTGLYNLNAEGAYPDHQQGLLEVMPQAQNMGKFRVPSLRNIELTAPYMHDGSVATLPEVIANYARHGRNIEQGQFQGDGRTNRFKDPLIDQIELSDTEQQDVVAFLLTLTDETIATNERFSNPFPPQGQNLTLEKKATGSLPVLNME